eukprot:CAMPEP_0178930432 /NCGR_PEP_ID=MMETSP0786-20121207/21217_1 /TAXON_ID=186022 /ORGANISM="Thalassionema frauenfeldii, Strain CCMP 1798" /LENGTH=100 /DNA_ID=CAMNT_0020606929 /DNA_START=201 /DNA_END=499 /DNA_ORIENTATION=+
MSSSRLGRKSAEQRASKTEMDEICCMLSNVLLEKKKEPKMKENEDVKATILVRESNESEERDDANKKETKEFAAVNTHAQDETEGLGYYISSIFSMKSMT